jgi:lipoate---protein ligase
MPWEVQHLTGPVRELHEQSAALMGSGEMGRVARVLQPLDRAVVLGSSQDETCADRDACAAAGVDVMRRRSGGGAVLVEPGSLIWVDLFVPPADSLWSSDVGRASWWVGEAWSVALGAAGLGDLQVWRGPMRRNPWSSLVCFSGLGAGEVVDALGRKLVGVSQRRTRQGALFQCACLVRWEPERLLGLLALDDEQRSVAMAAVAGSARGIGSELARAVEAHLVSALPGT